MNVMRETKNLNPLFRFTKYCFLCTFLVIIIIIILLLLLLLLITTTTTTIIIIRERWLDSCDPWLLVTHSKGIFPVDRQNWVLIVQGTFNLIRLSYFIIDHFYPLIIKTLMTQTSSYHESAAVTYQMFIIVESKMPHPKEKGLELLKWGIIRIYLAS